MATSNVEYLYEELRKLTDGGSESMTHEDAVKQIKHWQDTVAAQEAKIKELKRDLCFVERMANHHGQKASIDAKTALSFIQHHPTIREITKSYVDGVLPKTPDPYAEIAALRTERDALKADAERKTAEIEKHIDEISCAEAALEVFMCDFREDFGNNGFECLGEFIDAIRVEVSKERDVLRTALNHIVNDNWPDSDINAAEYAQSVLSSAAIDAAKEKQ